MKSNDYLTQDDIEKDLKAIEQAISKISPFRHKRIAHKEADKSVKIIVSFKDLFDTIDALKLYDWKRIFREPWEK